MSKVVPIVSKIVATPTTPHLPKRLLVVSIGSLPKHPESRLSVGHVILNHLVNKTNAEPLKLSTFEIFKASINVTDVWFYRIPGKVKDTGKNLTSFYHVFKNKYGKDKGTKVIVLNDELDLELGDINVKIRGYSYRGHNGLRSIQNESVLAKNYINLQLGIGRYYKGNKAMPGVVPNYLLCKFKDEEMEVLENTVTPKVLDVFDDMCYDGKYVFEMHRRKK